jgi:hypothetical protein
LRTFVNKIRNSGRPVAITTIDVGLASKEVEKLLSVGFRSVRLPGAAPTAAAPARSVVSSAPKKSAPVANGAKPAGPQADQRVLVVPRKLSAFVVQIDYLSIPEEKPAAGAEGEPKK